MAEIVGIVRDILLSIYLLAGILFVLALLVFAFLLYKAVKGLINVMTRTAGNFEKVSQASVEHIAKPLEEGVSVGTVAGNLAGFATGFVAGLRGRKKKEEEKKKKRRLIPFL
jgi:hypothetical protein